MGAANRAVSDRAKASTSRHSVKSQSREVSVGSPLLRLIRLSTQRTGQEYFVYATARKEEDLKALGDALEALRPPAGASQSEVLIVVFCDFEDADCGRLSPLHRTLETLYPQRARLVFRQDPSPKHPHAMLAAEASLAANEQGKFWEYHDVLFANPHDLSRSALERYAESLSLDMDRFRRALDEHKFAADIGSDVALARRLRITGTPTVFANAEPVEAPYGVAELTRILGRPSVQ